MMRWLLLLIVLPSTSVAQSHLLVVSGLGGEPHYSEAFQSWALGMADAAENRYGVPADRITVLTETPVPASGRSVGRSTREGVLQALRQIAQHAAPGDVVFLLLIGHGSADGEASRLNLPGPDLTAEELAEALAALPSQRLVVVNTGSASGGFLPALSGENRTVVTATSSPFERNETRFGQFFVEAFAGDGADVDKNGRVSVLEAYDYARREVERSYRSENLLLTEHALLDDNGDAQGTREPATGTADGSLARTLFLGGEISAQSDAPPELRAMLRQRQQLEQQIEQLKVRKEQMSPEAYQSELASLLVDLARISQSIREREGSR